MSLDCSPEEMLLRYVPLDKRAQGSPGFWHSGGRSGMVWLSHSYWGLIYNNWIYPGWWFGTMEFDDFPVGNVIIPTDELILFRGVGIPPIRYT